MIELPENVKKAIDDFEKTLKKIEDLIKNNNKEEVKTKLQGILTMIEALEDEIK